MKQLQNARDKVIMGPERKSRLPDEEANRITAYHEGGHVIVAYFTKESDPIHKVTIMPRGQSLGHTAYIPKKEAYHVTKAKLLAKMDTMMGGRAAEELIFGPDKITLGTQKTTRIHSIPRNESFHLMTAGVFQVPAAIWSKLLQLLTTWSRIGAWDPIRLACVPSKRHRIPLKPLRVLVQIHPSRCVSHSYPIYYFSNPIYYFSPHPRSMPK